MSGPIKSPEKVPSTLAEASACLWRSLLGLLPLSPQSYSLSHISALTSQHEPWKGKGKVHM